MIKLIKESIKGSSYEFLSAIRTLPKIGSNFLLDKEF